MGPGNEAIMILSTTTSFADRIGAYSCGVLINGSIQLYVNVSASNFHQYLYHMSSAIDTMMFASL